MDTLDFSFLQSQAKGSESVAIICNYNTVNIAADVYDHVLSINEHFKVHILEPMEVACRFKTSEYDFYVIITLECPFHSFKNATTFKSTDPISIEKQKSYIFDSYYRLIDQKNIHENNYVRRQRDSPDEKFIVTDSQRFYDYFFYVTYAKSISNKNEVVEKDKVRFHVSRLALIDKIKGKQTFGIFFASTEYKELAQRISKLLESKGKEVLMVFLKNISWERLVAIEFVEVLVVIDCPLYTHFDIDIHLPLVTPFELAQSFKSTWNGEYDINEFKVEDYDGDGSFEGLTNSISAEIVLKRKTQDLEYSVQDLEDMKIHPGLRGNSVEYWQNE